MSVRGDILTALQNALLGITVDAGYNNTVAIVMRRAFSNTDIDISKSPAIAIIDSGVDIPTGIVGVNQRSKMSITLNGIVRHVSSSPDAGDMSDQFNTFLDDIRVCLNGADLGAYACYCRLGEVRAFTEESRILFDQDVEILYYYDTGSTATTPSTPAIYGDNDILDDVRAELYSQMNSLKTAMASTSPRPLSLYNSHDQIKMTLPAMSVGITSVACRGKESGRSSSATRETYDIECEIRAHTDYIGGYLDEVTVTRLLNSASNWIQTHRGLTLDGFCFVDIADISMDEEFTHSQTIGGRIRLLITLQILHTQA